MKDLGFLGFCKYCGKRTTHTSLMCWNKPRKHIKQESERTKDRRTGTTRLWYELNPPDEKGLYYCYLRISLYCPYKLTRTQVTLEHIKSKVRYPELKYDVTNLKPACTFCNKLKGSLDLEDLVITYPKLQILLDS